MENQHIESENIQIFKIYYEKNVRYLNLNLFTKFEFSDSNLSKNQISKCFILSQVFIRYLISIADKSDLQLQKVYKRAMLKTQFDNQLATVKIEQFSTENRSQYDMKIQQSDKFDSEYLTFENEAYKRKENKAKHLTVKQNKDEANAARTARIVILFIILEQNGRRELVKIFQRLNIPIDSIKSRIRNIGNKQFINQFLVKNALKLYFIEAFELITQQKIKKVMRTNKNSSLEIADRVNLVIKHIEKFKELFFKIHYIPKLQESKPQIINDKQVEPVYLQKINQKQRDIKIKVQEKQSVLCPIPLSNNAYIYYMLNQGFHSLFY